MLGSSLPKDLAVRVKRALVVSLLVFNDVVAFKSRENNDVEHSVAEIPVFLSLSHMTLPHQSDQL